MITSQPPAISRLSRLIVTALLLLLSLTVNAASLVTEVDQTSVEKGQTLRLTIIAKGYPDTATIDLAPLQLQFDIVGQRKSRQSVINNTGRHSTTTIELELLPKALGEIVIPSLSISDNGEKQFSEAIVVKVLEAQNNPTSDANSEVSLDIRTNKDSVYVQEEFLLTLTLSYSININFGRLEHEPLVDANMALVNQRDYVDRIVGRKYIEISYAIKPQKTGKITIPAFKLPIETYQRGANRRRTLLTQPRDIEVKPPPSSWVGQSQPWLPGSDLTLKDSLESSIEVIAGQAIERTITVVGKGIYSEQIPPIEAESIDGMNVYQNNPLRDNQTTEQGSIGNYEHNVTLIPQKKGQYTLPAIAIHWWDVKADKPRVARLPERIIKVTSNANFIDEQMTQDANTATGASLKKNEGNSDNVYWLAALLILVAAVVTYFSRVFLPKYKSAKAHRHSESSRLLRGMKEHKPTPLSERKLYRQLQSQSQSTGMEFRETLLRWARRHFNHDIISMPQLIDYVPEASSLLRRYEETLFSRTLSSADQVQLQLELQADIVSTIRTKAVKLSTHKQQPLKPLYPSEG